MTRTTLDGFAAQASSVEIKIEGKPGTMPIIIADMGSKLYRWSLKCAPSVAAARNIVDAIQVSRHSVYIRIPDGPWRPCSTKKTADEERTTDHDSRCQSNSMVIEQAMASILQDLGCRVITIVNCGEADYLADQIKAALQSLSLNELPALVSDGSSNSPDVDDLLVSVPGVDPDEDKLAATLHNTLELNNEPLRPEIIVVSDDIDPLHVQDRNSSLVSDLHQDPESGSLVGLRITKEDFLAAHANSGSVSALIADLGLSRDQIARAVLMHWAALTDFGPRCWNNTGTGPVTVLKLALQARGDAYLFLVNCWAALEAKGMNQDTLVELMQHLSVALCCAVGYCGNIGNVLELFNDQERKMLAEQCGLIIDTPFDQDPVVAVHLHAAGSYVSILDSIRTFWSSLKHVENEKPAQTMVRLITKLSGNFRGCPAPGETARICIVRGTIQLDDRSRQPALDKKVADMKTYLLKTIDMSAATGDPHYVCPVSFVRQVFLSCKAIMDQIKRPRTIHELLAEILSADEPEYDEEQLSQYLGTTRDGALGLYMHFRADPDCIKYGDTKKVKWVLKKYEPEEYTVPICSHLGCDTPCPPGEHRSEQPDGSFLCHICNVATQNGITQRICQHCNMKTGNSAVPCPDASAGNIVYDCKGCYAKQHVIFCNDCGRECIGTENKRKVFDEDGQQLIGRFHCQACWGYYRNKKTRPTSKRRACSGCFGTIAPKAAYFECSDGVSIRCADCA